MSFRLYLFRKALSDLDEIRNNIARDNPAAANPTVTQLRKRFDLLTRQPWIGEQVSEFGGSVRAIGFRKYVIYYRIESETITILRVLHGSRDHTQLLPPQDL